MTALGIAAVDVVFAVALLTVVSCLAYLVYLTVRERSRRASSASPGVAPAQTGAARIVALPSLRPSIVRHHHAASS